MMLHSSNTEDVCATYFRIFSQALAARIKADLMAREEAGPEVRPPAAEHQSAQELAPAEGSGAVGGDDPAADVPSKAPQQTAADATDEPEAERAAASPQPADSQVADDDRAGRA
jgi:hypothetical protein